MEQQPQNSAQELPIKSDPESSHNQQESTQSTFKLRPQLDETSEPTKQPPLEQEMVNMFASVWVKVEVNEDAQDVETTDIMLEELDNSAPKPKRSKHNLPAKFKCTQCEYATPYSNCLKLHLLGHDGVKPFSCNSCAYTTKYPTALKRHMLVKHQLDSQVNTKTAALYRCKECNYTTHYKWNLNSHQHKHKEEKEYKCSECDYATSYRQHYFKHLKVHNKDESKSMVYKCDQCPFVTKFDGHITRHLAKIHNIVSDKANKCEFCDFSTKVNWRLTIHKSRSKQESLLKCGYCGFETYYMCESKIHKRMHFNELNKRTRKNDDDQSSRRFALEASQEIVTEELDDTEINEKMKEYTLDPECVDWKSIAVLESDDKEKPFQCHMCNYTARFKASVQRHFQRRHTGPKNRPYKCVNCDFSTKTKDQIALHNKRSISKFSIHCSRCEFSTQYKCEFAIHQKTHYDHECPNCDFKCRNKYDIQKHFAIVHLGDGLKCQYCDYQATRKESLVCHETIHTGNKPFKCTVPLCEYTSVRKSLLRNHMRRFHTDIQDDVTVVSENKIQSLKLPAEEILQHGGADYVQS